MRFEVYQDTKDEWRWRLRAANRKDIIAVSGEGYRNKTDCLHGIRLVRQAYDAPLFEL